MSFELRKGIKGLINNDEATLQVCKVVSVDKGKQTCEVESLRNKDITLYDVKLSMTSKTGLVLYPTIGSFVVVGSLEGQREYAVLFYSEITEAEFMNGQNDSGLVIIPKLVQRLNAIESALRTHIHPAPGGATGSPSIFLPNTNREQIENKNFKH